MSDATREAEAPTIGALAPWFGGKRSMAALILEEVGPHRAWWNPFCGSLALELAKPPAMMETVNDLHGDLINLARVLKGPETAEALYARAARLLFHEGLLAEAAGRIAARDAAAPAPEAPDIDRAEDFLVASWFGRNGLAGTAGRPPGLAVRYTANGGQPAVRWRSAVASIPAWHERLRTLTILNRDAFALLEKVDDAPGTAIYCDPPYLAKGARYVHDFDAEGHARLAAALARFRAARVVVSYYDDPRLDALYPGWTKRVVAVTKGLGNQARGSSAAKADEVLLINGPSRVAPAPPAPADRLFA